MIKVCINQDRFTQGISYGLWSFLTIGLVFIFIASGLEIQTLPEIPNTLNYSTFDKEICYEDVLSGHTCMTYFHWRNDINPIDRHNFSEITLIIDIMAIGFWIYHKQNKIKIGLCEKTGVTKQ